MRALIVDDNALVLRALADELGEDYDVVPASTAEQAISELDAGSFALVVCDYDLGEGHASTSAANGDQLLAYARSRHLGGDRVLLVGAIRDTLAAPRADDA